MFDRDDELNKLRTGLGYPVTLLLGIRRSGKSSLVKVLMSEEKDVIWIYLDLRKYEGYAYITYKHLLNEFERALNTWPKFLRELLRGIRGVNISGSGFEIRLSWSKDRVELADLFDRLSSISEREGRRVIIVFDESQELRKLKGGFNILYPLAYAYDNLKLSFIFTGSQIGMVYRFLRLKDPSSPLFGRAMFEVRVNPFTKEQSIEFLKAGFREVGISVSNNLLEGVYDELGGIPGWLTYYGFNYLQFGDHEEAIKRTLEYAVQLVRQEFENFLRGGREEARERYYAIMVYARMDVGGVMLRECWRLGRAIASMIRR
ncbi:ATP-binding protein [Vulcanisaeta distributa]|uniref:AAA family ATPase n=1 Tax=Vulcanisaeta distributa TaxID=164451 RepID=UPI000A8F9DAF|nr:ATP-binding protein [Vulcanisaeta distributa]